jgi:SSS family solute:Na+ symporter
LFDGQIQIEPVNLVMTLLILLVLGYTILGGMVSVVITDYVQFVVLSFGMLLACGIAVVRLGWSNIVNTVWEVHGSAGFDPLSGEGFGASYVVWMVFVAGIVSCAVWQTAVMRACAAESTRVVKRLYVWSSIGFLIRFLIPQFLGICALTYLWSNPDAREIFFAGGKPVGDAETTLKAMPTLLGVILPAGLVGLVGAGMLAAFMSTHDSYLLCWSAVLVQDVIDPIMGGKLSTRARLTLARILIFLIGIFLLVWSLWYPLKQDLWDYMAVSGSIYFIGAFALLLGGLYWPRASTVGAYVALAIGTLSVFGLTQLRVWLADQIAFVAGWNEPPEITEDYVGLVVVGLALAAMIVCSLIFPDRRSEQGISG